MSKKSTTAVQQLRLSLAEKIFQHLGASDEHITVTDLKMTLTQQGILTEDPRIAGLLGQITNANAETRLSQTELAEALGDQLQLLENVVNKNLIIPDFEYFCVGIERIFTNISKNHDGEPANYIPELAKANPEHFAVSICTIDGQCLHLGASNTLYSAQSSCKPINYCIALETLGETEVHRYIGREASGHGFNELTLDREQRPHNPMINAGAIMACALIKPELNVCDRFNYVLDQWQRLTNQLRPSFNQAIYQSEKASADRNFALAYFMNENKAFPQNTDLLEVLNFYFHCCAIETNTNQQATIAATLANGGYCPFNEHQCLQDTTVKHCLSQMLSSGMYDYSGEFAFSVGLPAKSSVSGALLLVIPNVMGIAIWSPRLDSYGNSVRGVAFAKALVQHYNFHMYDSLTRHNSKYDPRQRKINNTVSQIAALCWAAYYGDYSEVKRLVSQRRSLINKADYDGRTALHLAACEGHVNIARYLIKKGAHLNALDRWGLTPLAEAQRAQHTAMITLLSNEASKNKFK